MSCLKLRVCCLFMQKKSPAYRCLCHFSTYNQTPLLPPNCLNKNFLACFSPDCGRKNQGPVLKSGDGR